LELLFTLLPKYDKGCHEVQLMLHKNGLESSISLNHLAGFKEVNYAAIEE
jgi:hypothetical protein